MQKKKKGGKSSSSGLVLPGPNDLNIPPDNLHDYVICLYGKKAIGKTTLASQFPGAIVGQLEEGRKNLKIRQYTLDQGWNQTRDFIEACTEDDTVETVVIDTIDKLYEQVLAYECDAAGITDPGDVDDYGATWRKIAVKMNEALNSVRDAGKGLVVLSHEQGRKVKVRSGEPYDEIEPSCQKAPRRWIEEACDIVLYYHYHEKERAISVRPLENANMEAWCACGPSDHFLDPNGIPLSMFMLGNNPSDIKRMYEKLDAAFHNKVWDAIRGKSSPQGKKRRTDDE